MAINDLTNNVNAQENKTNKIKTYKVVYPQIYSYTLPEEHKYDGSQKIGYTERRDVNKRIYEQTHTAAMQLNPEIKWHQPAFFADNKTDFKDKDFHKFLIKNGIQQMNHLGTEWFYFNGDSDHSLSLYHSFRNKGYSALQEKGQKIPYILRDEQEDAVDLAKNYFAENEKGMLG